MTRSLRARAGTLSAPWRVATGCSLVAVLVFGSQPLAAHAGESTAAASRRVARGVRYERVVARRGPWRIGILSVSLGAPSRIKVALAHGRLNGQRERTSSLARRHGAIAGVNGDFGWTRPVHALATRGTLLQWSRSWPSPYNFGVDATESAAYVGRFDFDAWVTGIETGVRPLHSINAGPPKRSRLALFTPHGGLLERPPRRACSARLGVLSRPRAVPGAGGFETAYSVEKVKCRYRPLWRSDGTVLSARRRSPSAEHVTAAQPGGRARIGWSTGRPHVSESLGGFPLLVRDGRIARRALVGSRPFFGRHPRTGVGYDADRNRVLLVTVDGRRPGYSIGMRLKRFARVFRARGCEWALNLDGGGSTTMVVRGRVRNRPSDGSERPVSSALLVLPSRPGSPKDAAPPRPQATETLAAAAADQGSTGGLVSALKAEGRPLPPPLKAAARFLDRHRQPGAAPAAPGP